MTTIPLVWEIQLTIADPRADQDVEVHRPRHVCGREQEIKDITRLHGQRRHVLLVGDRGIGKSHLLLHVRDEILDPETTIFLDDFKAMKSILRSVAQTLHQRGHLVRFRDVEDQAKAGERGLWGECR